MFRRGNKKDIPFITNSWLKSYRDGLAVRAIPHDVYYYHQHKLIEKLLPRCVNLVVCRSDDPDQILAYVIAEKMDTALVIHYMYVKHTFRRLGLATQMVDKLRESEGDPPVMITHRTYAYQKIRETWEANGKENKMQGWVYNPFLAWRLVELNHE